MSDVRAVPFHPLHAQLMELREHEKQRFGADSALGLSILAGSDRTLANTLIVDGRLLAVVGFTEMWPGLVEVWIAPSIYVSEYAIVFAKAVKSLLNTLITDIAPDRIQTHTVDDELHNRWMRFVGFKCESGPMEKYSLGVAYKIWSIVK